MGKEKERDGKRKKANFAFLEENVKVDICC